MTAFVSAGRSSIPNGRPTIVAGIRPSPMGSLESVVLHAQMHQFFAMDMDLRRSLIAPPIGHASNLVRLRSIWVPGSVIGPLAEKRTNRLWSFLEYASAQMGLRTVVIPRSSEVNRGEFLGAEMRQRLQRPPNSAIRLAIGIKGSVVHRGHDQLAQLQMLRHTAEEWDLDLALDLAGDVPHYLEAEAAVLRLLPRLTLVRIPSWVSASGEINAADPISRRVVSILADQGYSGTISIIPAGSPWRTPWASYPATSEEWTRTMILDQYDRQRTDDEPTPYISPELFREQY